MEKVLKKVTAFITRERKGELELLLFKHPNAGIQIPGGTVEENETPLEAVVRETNEETGLKEILIKNFIGTKDKTYPDNCHIVLNRTKVYSRPDKSSFDWATFRRGIPVHELRKTEDFIQVEYREYNQYPDYQYITYSIRGWVPFESLSKKSTRYFYHVLCCERTPEIWEMFTDNHNFKLFWAPLKDLPDIVDPQNQWLDYVVEELGYNFTREQPNP